MWPSGRKAAENRGAEPVEAVVEDVKDRSASILVTRELVDAADCILTIPSKAPEKIKWVGARSTIPKARCFIAFQKQDAAGEVVFDDAHSTREPFEVAAEQRSLNAASRREVRGEGRTGASRDREALSIKIRHA